MRVILPLAVLDRVVPPGIIFFALWLRAFSETARWLTHQKYTHKLYTRRCFSSDEPPAYYVSNRCFIFLLPGSRNCFPLPMASRCMAQENFLKKMVPVSWSVLFSLSLYLYTGTMERPAKVNVCIEKTVIFGRIYRRLCALLNPARACLRWQIFR